MKLVICFLNLAETERSRCSVDGIPKRLTNRYHFGIGTAGCGTVSFKLIGISQRISSGSAKRQVVGVQILQGAARLGNDSFCIVVNNSQGSTHGGDTPYNVLGLII